MTRITIAQLNPVVGDIWGNYGRIRETLERTRAERPELLIFPELFLVGYPPRDLLERRWFIQRVQEAVEAVAALSASYPETGILFGAPLPSARANGKALINAAVLAREGRIVAVRPKALLPTYDVFDESRYFEAAHEIETVPHGGALLGVHVCEDAWTDPALWNARYLYNLDPVAELGAQGATLLINLSASPFHVGKEEVRYRLMSQHARAHGAPFVYVNQVGANDELIFDGRSMVFDAQGAPLAICKAFEEEIRTVETAEAGARAVYEPQDEIASVHDALILGLRDYMRKCGFTKAVVGLSGGIDSALTFYLAAQAVGPENILGVSMPSPFSSEGSMVDAHQLAENLGAECRTIPITAIYQSYLKTMTPHFEGRTPDTTEENIQARIRGNILMAISNKYGHLVLSTGNKSELAVGYCTLYGDMSGGLAVISDVPKTMVYALARYANRHGELIPQSSIDKPPSAELKPDQVDQDTLPPYPVLDGILRLYIEEGCSIDEIVAQGYERETAAWVARTVDRNEYKRRQAAPGLRVTTKAFGTGRRMPIAAVKTP
jgi:NAD+ synthase (glutamine-hydrolysing)